MVKKNTPKDVPVAHTTVSAGTRTIFFSEEDGTTSYKPVELLLDTQTQRFVLPLPNYVHLALGCDAAIDACSAVVAAAQFENHTEAYSRWKLASKVAPMIMIEFEWTADDRTAGVRLDSMPVFVFDAPGGRVVFARNADGSLGQQQSHMGNHLLIPDAPEFRAKVASLLDSVTIAATTLAGLAKAEDPLTYFMNIGEDLTVIEPETSVVGVRQSLPLEDDEL